MSSIEDVFNEFESDEEEKPTSEDLKKPSKKSETEAVSVPEGGDESKEEVEKETPATSTEENVDDWFETAEEESAKDQPVEDQPVEEKSVEDQQVEDKSVNEKEEKIPSEVLPATATPSVEDDDWFETVEEAPTGDKPAEDKLVEEAVAGETPIEETAAADAPIVVDDWFQPSEDQTPIEIPTKTSVDTGSLVGIKASPIVRQAVSAEVMKEQMRQFQNLKASLLDKSDIATIQNKPFIKRSGWRKLALAFNLSDEIIKAEKEIIGDEFEWRIWVKVWAPNGRFATGIGGCCSDERDFAHLRHDVYAVAHTRAKNRALSDLIGSGEVSWEELRGMA